MAPALLDRLRAETDRLERDLTPDAPQTLFLRQGWFGPKRLVVLYHAYRRSPLIADLFHHPAVCAFAGAVLGGEPVYAGGLYMDKKPGVRYDIVWHQDTGFLVSRDDGRSVQNTPKAGMPVMDVDDAVAGRILALQWNLDDQDEGNACLRVRPGTHRLGRLDARARAEALARVPERVLRMPAGSCVIYFPHLLHASMVNRSKDRRRRVLRYIYRPKGLAEDRVPWYDFAYPPPAGLLG